MNIYKIVGRESETEAIVSTIGRGSNYCMFSPQYRGKTYLLYHVMEELTQRKYTPIYFNCMTGFNEKTLLELFSKTILKTMSFKLKNIFEDSQKYLPNIRPKISMNPIHGVDIRIDYNITARDIKQYLTELFEIPAKIYKDTNEKMVIILDEYQSLVELKSAGMTEIISRNLNEGVNYIFASSDKKDLNTVLPSKDYSKLKIESCVNLQKIPANVLYFYIENTFKDNSIKISNSIVDKLINMTEGEIAFISKILRKLVYKGKIFKRISLMDISNSVREIVGSYEDVFFNYFDSLSAHQKNLIIAIAREGGEQVFKGEFIYHNGLVSVPSVQTSINALIKKKFIHKEDGKYIITNMFYKEWLKKNFQ